MTESMRMRVALAICCRDGCRKDGASYDPIKGSVAICQAHTFEQDALAAIEAMREPTEAMIEAAVLSPGDGNLGVDAENTWQAMIDAALGERE